MEKKKQKAVGKQKGREPPEGVYHKKWVTKKKKRELKAHRNIKRPENTVNPPST